MKTKPNHPINPIFGDSGFATSVGNLSENDATGLTKREYFAALAMQGLLAHYGSEDIDNLVKESVLATDALIEELNKSQNQ